MVIGPKDQVYENEGIGMYGRAYYFDHESARKAKKVLGKRVN